MDILLCVLNLRQLRRGWSVWRESNPGLPYSSNHWAKPRRTHSFFGIGPYHRIPRTAQRGAGKIVILLLFVYLIKQFFFKLFSEGVAGLCRFT
jgi:hypothetical protein